MEMGWFRMALTLDVGADRLLLAATPAERAQALEVGTAPLLLVGPDGPAPMPAELSELLARVVSSVATGATVTIGSTPEELTTSVAARQLGVTRPTLMRMIRTGQIPAHKVGTHHRLKTTDVLEAKRQRLTQQRQAFDQLRDLEDQLDQFR